jgi:hypothetical protein
MAKLLERQLEEILSVYDFVEKGQSKDLTAETKTQIMGVAARLGTRMRGSISQAPHSFIEDALFWAPASADSVVSDTATASAIVFEACARDYFKTCGPNDLEQLSREGWRTVATSLHQRIQKVDGQEVVLSEMKFVLSSPREPEDKLT